MLKSKENFQKLLQILKRKRFFCPTIWSYSIFHNDLAAFKVFLRNSKPSLRSSIDTRHLDCKYLKIEKFTPLDYEPLINPRSFSLGKKQESIRNTSFRQTYTDFLKYCSEKEYLEMKDWTILSHYLILQERIEEAKDIFTTRISTIENDL